MISNKSPGWSPGRGVTIRSTPRAISTCPSLQRQRRGRTNPFGGRASTAVLRAQRWSGQEWQAVGAAGLLEELKHRILSEVEYFRRDREKGFCVVSQGVQGGEQAQLGWHNRDVVSLDRELCELAHLDKFSGKAAKPVVMQTQRGDIGEISDCSRKYLRSGCGPQHSVRAPRPTCACYGCGGTGRGGGLTVRRLPSRKSSATGLKSRRSRGSAGSFMFARSSTPSDASTHTCTSRLRP